MCFVSSMSFRTDQTFTSLRSYVLEEISRASTKKKDKNCRAKIKFKLAEDTSVSFKFSDSYAK